MEIINGFVSDINNILFSETVVFALLGTGLLFTLWSMFGQYRAMTHGVAVVRGKYDHKDDPGAINHFQALSAALSATVGLGNIGGVALAVALGGPGAVLWMWVIGLVGMALKMTEVTQSMLYRNTEDPDNPHGGPMFVVKKGLAEAAKNNPMFCGIAGIFFGVTIAWAGWASGSTVAMIICGLVGLALMVLGFVAGATLGSIVGGIFVVTLLISAITGGNMFQAWNVADITQNYFGVPQIATGIILCVIVGLVIIGGIKRIGSVAGRIVPFMCVIYLIAAVYVLIMNAGEIPAMIGMIFKHGLPTWLGGESASASGAFLGGTFGFAAMWGIKRALFSSEAGQGSAPIAHAAAKTDEPVREGVVAGLEPFIDTLVVCTLTALVILSTGTWNRDAEASFAAAADVRIVEVPPAADAEEDAPVQWTIETGTLPAKTAEAKRVAGVSSGPGWSDGQTVFMRVHADQGDESTQGADQGNDILRVMGTVSGNNDDGYTCEWTPFTSTGTPTLVDLEGEPDLGVYGNYAGASLTAHAFDRVNPGLGKWLITFAAWLFAISTMISWSYYGEQGMVYILGEGSVLPYKVIYCLLIVVSTLGFIRTDAELDMWTTLGLGVMLVANIPIMLLFGGKAMAAYHGYMGKLGRGEFIAHDAPSITDVMEGKED